MSLMKLLLLHLGPSRETHLSRMAGQAGAASICGASKPSNRHAVRDSGSGERERIDVGIRVAGGETWMAAKGGRRESCVSRLCMSRVVLWLLLLLEVGLL
jgi:hypothetical protein